MHKIGFVTCVELGFGCMKSICASGGQLHLAITLKDSKARNKSGRIYLDEFCSEQQIPLLKIDHINDEVVREEIARHGIDWLFIVGWSQIAGAEVLAAPTLGCIGIHPTLLPIGRGRAPIPWAIIKGLEETGVTMFVLDEGVDSGPVIAQKKINLDDTVTATTLYADIGDLHMDVIADNWSDLVDGNVTPWQQDESGVTVWPGRKPADGEILQHMTVVQVDRLVRGVTRPYPGAFYAAGQKQMRIWSGHISSADNASDSTDPVIDLSDGQYVPDEWEWEEG